MLKSLLRIAGTVLLIDAFLVGCAFLWVAIYAHGLNPGHDPAFYEAHAEVASPWVSVVVGAPVFWWVGRRFRAPWVVFGTFALVDLAIVLAFGVGVRPLVMSSLSLMTKAGATWWGRAVAVSGGP